MALFKILRGNSSKINFVDNPFRDGYCYFAADTGLFYIDYEDANKNQLRIPLNSADSMSIIDQNSGAPLKLWYGTAAQLPPENEREENTIYFTTDDESGDIEANSITYNNTLSGLSATSVQHAIDEIALQTKTQSRLKLRDSITNEEYYLEIQNGSIVTYLV